MALFELSAINLLDFVTKFIPDNAKENEEHQKAGILFRTLYAECVNNIYNFSKQIKKQLYEYLPSMFE